MRKNILRLISFIIDYIIGYLPVILLTCYILVFAYDLFIPIEDDTSLGALPFAVMISYMFPYLFFFVIGPINESFLICLCLVFSKTIYYTLMEWALNGNTIGRKSMRLELVSINGEKITLSKRILRNLLKTSSEFFIFLNLIPIFRKDKRTFYDIICKTDVIIKK